MKYRKIYNSHFSGDESGKESELDQENNVVAFTTHTKEISNL